MRIRIGFVAALLISLQATGAYCLPLEWNNSGTGPTAGDWFDTANWTLFTVPTSLDNVQISNGGEAKADLLTAVGSVNANRLEVGKNNGVGIFTNSGVAVNIGIDFDIGEIGGSFASGPVVVSSNGTATIRNAPSVQIGSTGVGNFDIGKTSATLGAQAVGTGNVTISDILGTVSISGDIDVGQTSSATNSIAQGGGTLLLERLGALVVGTDFDIGQTSGGGQATGTGLVTIRDTQSITVGDDFDIGRTSGSAGSVNSGNGTISIFDSSVSVGFASAVTPGSLSVGNASVVANEQANAFGRATFERVSLNVADRINVGGLTGGGTNPLTTTDGAVTFLASMVSAPIVEVAVIPAGTVGTAIGQLHLNPSLLNVSGPLTMGIGAILTLDLAGTTRADGTGSAGQYGAIDASSASIGGVLEIFLTDGFSPSPGDFFDLLSTTGIIGGAFSSTVLPVLTPNLSWNLIQTNNLLRLEVQSVLFDGDFNGDLDVDGGDFLTWQRGFGIPSGASKGQGDANLSGSVDGLDRTIWESTFGDTLSPIASAVATQVPEPSSWLLAALAGIFLGNRRNQRQKRKGRCMCLDMGGIEQ